MTSSIIIADKDKRDLLSRLSGEHAELALFCDGYGYFDGPPYGKLVRKGVIIISTPYDYDELEKWWHFHFSYWNLIGPARDDYEFIDTFKLTDDEIAKVMRAHGLSIIIDGFPFRDLRTVVEWKVHVNEAEQDAP